MAKLSLILVCQILVTQSKELFQNADFEDGDVAAPWNGNVWGYKLDVVNDPAGAHSGNKYAKVHSRTQYWQGPGQVVNMELNTNYRVSCYFKILNNNTKMFQRIQFAASYQWMSDYLQGGEQAKKRAYYDLAEHHILQPSNEWIHLEGDFTSPSKAWHIANIYIQGPDPGIDFLIDDASLVVVPNNNNWKTEANQRIEQIRKSNITLRVSAADNMDPQKVNIEVKLKKHLFGFGAVVDDFYFLNPNYKQYQNLYLEFFNWAVVGSLKWGYNQGTVEHPNYSNTIKVIDALRSHGMPVRGHNMFWGVGSNDPSQVRQMNATELKTTIQARIKYMTDLTRGKLEHWDINNELLHGQVYEEITGDRHYSEKIYDMVHAADPGPKLFLNDYDVLAVGSNTDQYLSQALEFKNYSHIDGLGLQGHMRTNTEPNPTMLKLRLDTLAKSGLPLWITELTVPNADENIRADWYENVYRLLFSHPAVEGALTWSFWDGGGYSSVNEAFVSGNSFYVNAAGRRYLDLIKKEWSTNVNFNMSANQNTFTFRGFQGDYDVIVRYNGKPVKLSHFSVGKTGTTVDLSVMNGAEISVPGLMTTPAAVHVHHVTHNGYHHLGQQASSSTSATLQCATRYSTYSEIGDDKVTSVGCLQDEVLTSCSMITQDHQYFRDGDKIVLQSGAAVCQAVNAWRSTAGVQAVARCCKLNHLKCQYAMDGPSGNQPDDQAEVVCPNNTYATGCSSYTYYGQMDGAYSTLQSCVAQTAGRQGTFSYAACCNAPNLTCKVKMSAESDLKKGSNSTMTCDAGWTMLGCSVYTEDANTAGAFIRDGGSTGTDTCYAVNGQDKFPGEMGVKAYATCCKI